MLAKVFLATWITTSAALAVGPWDDRTIEVDKEAEIKVLKELRETRRATVQRIHQLHSLGLARPSDMAQASAAYFVAAARLAWAEGEFQQSYRLSQLAVKASEYAQSALAQAEERGLSSLTEVLEARVHLAEAKVVLLRYEAVAKERGIKLEPIEPIDESEFPGLL